MANTSDKKSRFTLFIKDSSIYKLDYITKVEFINNKKDLTRTDLVNTAVDEYIAKWEKKNGEIPAK